MPASNVWPILTTPISLPETATPYDEALIWFSMAPRTDGNRLDVSFSIILRPYRRLTDGTLDMAPEYMQSTIAVGSARDLKQAGNAAAMKLAKNIMALLVTYAEAL